MISGILAKASDIGFNALRVAQAQMGCCGAIIKYRVADESAEYVFDHDMDCPHCGGEGWYYGDVDDKGNLEIETKPMSHDFIDDLDMDDINHRHAEQVAEASEYAELDCPECGNHEMDFSEGFESENMRYPAYKRALRAGYQAAGGGSYECPTCDEDNTVGGLMDRSNEPTSTMRYVQDNYQAATDGGGRDEEIAMYRMPYAYSPDGEYKDTPSNETMANRMKGRPSIEQLKLRGKLRNRGVSPRDAGFGYRLNQLAERHGLPPAKYNPDKDKRRQMF